MIKSRTRGTESGGIRRGQLKTHQIQSETRRTESGDGRGESSMAGRAGDTEMDPERGGRRHWGSLPMEGI